MELDLVPDLLYRVYSDSSMSQFDYDYGFEALDSSFPLRWTQWPNKMWRPVRQHLDWSNRNPTPFVSTWACVRKAIENAERREYLGHQNVMIAVIDTGVLESYHVWFADVVSIVDCYNVYVRNRRILSSQEYLCLNAIPSDAVRSLVRREELLSQLVYQSSSDSDEW